MQAPPPTTTTRWQLLRAAVGARLPQRWRTGQRRAALVGASWSLVGQGGTQALRLVSTLVLARLLLSPEAFGLVALVNVFMSGLEMLSDVGLGPNIIQHPRGADPDFLRTAFSIQLARAASLWLAATALAYPFAWFYEEAALGPLIMTASLATLVRGAANVGVHVLTRRVMLRPMTLLTLGSEFAGFLVAVSWALLTPSVWALVVGAVATATAYSIGSYMAVETRHRPGWDVAVAREILKFGGWVFVGTATWFLCSQGERLFLGKLVTPAELGCFALASSIALLPARYVTQLSGSVVYPIVASGLRTDRARGLAAFRRMRLPFALLGVVTAVGCALCGGPLSRLLLGPGYAASGWMLQLLGLRVGFDILTLPVSGLILASGKTVYSAAQNTLRLAALVVGLQPVLASYGLFWGLVWLITCGCIAYGVSLYAIRRLAPELLRFEALLFAGMTGLSVLLGLLLVHR